MKVGIGYCNGQDAFESGVRVANTALQNGSINEPDLAIAFCSGKMNHDEFYKGIKKCIPGAPVIGGSTIGIITNNELSYNGFPSGIALLQSDDIKFQVVCSGSIDKDEKQAGQAFAEKFTTVQQEKLLLMFYDSVKIPASPESPPVMNASPLLIEGIVSGLKTEIPVIGGGVIGDYGFGRTKQFCGQGVSEQAVAGAVLSGPVHVYHRIMHGCSPLDGIYRKITRMEKAAVFELDGKPVINTINELYGNTNWQKQHPLNLLTLGVNLGDRLKHHEDRFVNRLITGILPGGSGIGLFEPDLEEGMEIQFMLRDGNMMIESARNNSEKLLETIINNGRVPVFGLYIDCAGRAAEQSNTETEEAAEVQRVMNKYNTPLLGFYSGVEICPVSGKSRGLDWTGVLTVLAVDR